MIKAKKFIFAMGPFENIRMIKFFFNMSTYNCKSFVVSGEATIDLFNSEEELFLETFLANN